MRELSLVKTVGVSGYYSEHDLVLQMMFYGDITPFRCARLMRLAEEEHAAGRKVLLLTENDFTDHLSSVGFAVYRPIEDGLVPEADAAALIARIVAGKPVVINTNQIDQPQKNELIRHIVRGLARISLRDFSLVVESTESFFPRRRSRGDTAGVDTLNNLLKRAKASDAHFAFACESPEEVAVEISNSCGTPIVSVITNQKRMKAVSAMVDPRIAQCSTEIYGVKSLNPNDFYIYNGFTAPRQGTRQFELDINTNIESLTRFHIVPQWLQDKALDCGFDPIDPKPGKRRADDLHKEFIAELEKARADAADEPERIAASAGSGSISELIATPSETHPNVIHMLPRPTSVAARQAAPQKRAVSSGPAIERMSAAGIQNAGTHLAYASAVLNAREGRFSVSAKGRSTPNTVAKRVIADELLREAIAMGISMAKRLSGGTTGTISGTALATAFYQALKEDRSNARRFHDDLNRDAPIDDGAAIGAALQRLGEIEDLSRRDEAQYQFMRSAWAKSQASGSKLSKAA